jgi:Ca-activated chloride channel homolog
MKRATFVVFLVLAFLGTASAGQPAPDADRTLSPYFFVRGGDPSVDRLPLKSTSAAADIAGVIARVTVAQVYRNEGSHALEAIYVFPGSTRAAVHAMTMKIGDRVIRARIEERQAARRQYEQARQAGQTASLLEQQRPNVFQMNVANILPGDEIRVELVYTELLVPEKGVYEFVYPTVVGPRYTKATAATAGDNDRWVQSPYLRQGRRPTSAFEFRARIAAGMTLRDVASPSHQIAVEFGDARTATVALARSDAAGGNRDVVLRYRLADDRIETGLILHEAAGENFFLCLVEPPQRFPAAAVPPREYVFVMDVSGSMNGFPIETSKELLGNLLATLRPGDYFNVLFFAGGNYELSPASLEATEANKALALREIGRQHGGGGTELLPALRRAFDLPRARGDMSRVVVIATDGYVDVEREAFTLIRNHLSDASVFTFGIGSSVNRHLIEGMARVGEGSPFVVLNPAEAPAAAARFLDYIDSPLLTHVEVRASGFDIYDLEPSRVPDVFADRPLVLVGKFRGEPAGTITVTGFTGQGRFERRIAVSRALVSERHEALKYLWARERLSLLSDFATLQGGDTSSRQEITALGLKYSLLTEFTSFVAIDERVRRQGNRIDTVVQPLPLPQGVSDLAVGGSQGGTRVVAEKAAFLAAPASMADARLAGNAAAARPASAPPPPQAAQRHSAQAPRVSVVENHLTGRVGLDATGLATAIEQALASAGTCAPAPGASAAVRLKITFDARGHVAGVEQAEASERPGASPFLACVRAALQRALAVPSATGGYLVVSIAQT